MTVPDPRDAQPGRGTPRTAEELTRMHAWKAQQAGLSPNGWQYPPPGPWGSGSGPPPRRGTSGLAIASLVLGLLWLGGMGSLLAIIFAASGRKAISRSGGWLGGDGLAIAGMVLGIVGLVGAVLLYVLVGVAATTVSRDIREAAAPKVVALGQSVATSGSDDNGISSVTVYSVAYPTPAAVSETIPVGYDLAAVDVQLCAGPTGAQTSASALLISLVFADGQIGSMSSVEASKQPEIRVDRPIAANRCVRGYLTFQYASGTNPTAVRFWPGPFDNYEWMLPAQSASR